jgi:hypothetical protein
VIYPFIEHLYGPDAGKITGIFLLCNLQQLFTLLSNKDLFFQTAQNFNVQVQQSKVLAAQAQVIPPQ